jgi:hypothetical protein
MYPAAVAVKLRAGGHDVVAVLEVEVGLAARSDGEILEWAARNSTYLVTENVRDFARLCRSMPHAGVLLVAAKRFRRTQGGMARLTVALENALIEGRLPPPRGLDWLVD